MRRFSLRDSTYSQGKSTFKTETVSKYFGELEIRGLIIISYFSLFYVQEIPEDISRRCSKLIILLTREVVTKFENNPKFIHLLTILL